MSNDPFAAANASEARHRRDHRRVCGRCETPRRRVRLIIGVHRPNDVLAAACIGIFIPLAISLALELNFD